MRNAVSGDGGVLDQLGEAEHPALALEGDRPLQHGLLGRLDHRDEASQTTMPMVEQHDRRPQRRTPSTPSS